MSRITRGNWEIRTLVLVAVLGVATAFSLSGCAFSARTVGQHDPTVEAIKALADVLKAQQPPAATPSPTPSPTPDSISFGAGVESVPLALMFGIEPCELRACDFWDRGCPVPPTGPCLDGKPLGSSERDIKAAMKRAEARRALEVK